VSSGLGNFLGGAVSPGDGFVVCRVVFEAAVEDADETVAQGTQGGMMGVGGGPPVS